MPMFLRLVTHTIREEEAVHMAEAYERSVLAAFRTTPGCSFASLLQNIDLPRECISLTVWNSQKEAIQYEESGLYSRLVDSLRPFFVESTEFALQLSDDLSLEYTPIISEPTISRFNNSITGSSAINSLKATPYAVQILTLTVQEDQIPTFEALFTSDIHPKFKAYKGYIDLILLRRLREYHIISFWDATVDLHSSSEVHSVSQFIESIYRTLPSFIQWRVSHRSAARISASSEDVRVTVYRCLTAEWFSR
jgi:heme-degrading monooxygenase HmoA